MEKYIEFREGLIDNRGERANIIRVEDLPKAVNPLKDAYRSLFYYDSAILKHVTDTGSVSGYRGKVGVDVVAFDMDNQDLEKARQDTIALVDKLKAYGINEGEVAVYFSGRKGFSVEILTQGIAGLGGVLSENIPVLTKKLAIQIAGDLESFDRVIYNHNRLYRLAGTLHQKDSDVNGVAVRLYKTALSLDMLRNSTVGDIQTYSLELQPAYPLAPIKDTDKLSETIKGIEANINTIVRELPTINNFTVNGLPDDSLAPKGYKVCLWRLAQGTVTDSRDNALLRIADHERKLGFPPEVIKGKLLGVLEVMNRNNPEKAKLDPILEADVDRIIRQTLNNTYDFGCNDPILASVCSRKCYLAPSVFKEESTSVGSPLDAYHRYINFAKSYFANRVPTGFRIIDDEMPFLVGTTNLLIGKPGTGKTSLMLNILKNANEANLPAIFFSIDMSEEMLIQKAAPILIRNADGTPKYTAKEVTELHARGNTAVMQEAEEAFHKLSRNVLISSKASMDLEELSSEIKRQELTLGRKIKLVIIDYVQLLKSQYESGSHAAGNYNATRLREMAKEMNLCFLLLSQTSRANGGADGDAPIGINSAKGSGAWEEQAHNVLTCWRPFSVKKPQYDFVMTVRLAKNRLGQCKNADLYFHGPSGVLRDLEPGEQIVLNGIREEIEETNDRY